MCKNQKVINELAIMEKEAILFAKKCSKARRVLESVNSPAPKRGRRVFSDEQELRIIADRRRNRLRIAK